MRRQDSKHYIEILPAAWLPHRAAWQAVAQALPAGACLLIANLRNRQQTQLILQVAQAFKKAGRQVIIWAAG